MTISRRAGQRRTPHPALVVVLPVALILGVLGIAVHVLWAVALITLAAGLGVAIANDRRDGVGVGNRRARPRDAEDGSVR
jgi:hypothetical protein